MPDLVVDSVSADWNLRGECLDLERATLEVQLEVANVGGQATEPFTVEVSGIDFSDWEEREVAGLAAGESRPLELTLRPYTDEGEALDQYALLIVLDLWDEVTEQDEDNNYVRHLPQLLLAGDLCAPAEAAMVERVPIPLYEEGEQLHFHSINMMDATRGWAIVGEGEQTQHIVRTVDGGESWFDVTPPELSIIDNSCGDEAFARMLDANTAWVAYRDVLEFDEGYCFYGPAKELWHTTDGGQSWRLSTFVQRNPDTFGAIGSGFPMLRFVDAQFGWALRDFFAGAGSSAIEFYQTTDGGHTWRLIPDTYLFRVTGLDFLDLKHGWSTVSYGLGYIPPISLGQTHDGGATWEYSALPLPAEQDQLHDCGVGSPTIQSATAGRVVVWCTTVDLERARYEYQTDDGGQSWNIQPLTTPAAQYVSAASGWRRERLPAEQQTDPERQLCGLFWTYDGGQSWSQSTTLDCASRLEFVNAQLGWALAPIDEFENELQITRDGGRTWQMMQPTTVARPFTGERQSPARLVPLRGAAAITADTASRVKLLQTLPVQGVTAIALSPFRGRLMTGHEDGTVTVWDLEVGGYGGVARFHTDWIYDMVVVDNPSLWATASKDGDLAFWFLYGNTSFDRHTDPGGEISSLTGTADGTMFASGGQDSVIRIWRFEANRFGDVNPPAQLSEELMGHQGWVWDLALSPNGRLLASASADRSIRLWEVETGGELASLTAHQATVGAIAFSPDGRRLASAAWDGSVVVWDVASWEPLWESNLHGQRVHSISFSADGSAFATGAGGGELFLWSTEDGELLGRLPAGTAAVRVVYFDASGQLLWAASDDGGLSLWGIEQ